MDTSLEILGKKLERLDDSALEFFLKSVGMEELCMVFSDLPERLRTAIRERMSDSDCRLLDEKMLKAEKEGGIPDPDMIVRLWRGYCKTVAVSL